MSESIYLSANLWRRMAAMVYDSLLIFAVLIVVGATTLPFTNGLGISRDNIIFKLYVFGAIYVFLGWFWTHGGQTLGMRAWKIKLIQRNGNPVTWRPALFYYLLSLPMWGFLIFTIAVNGKMIPAPAFLVHTPHWVLYTLALSWFVFDHLPNNWREKASGLWMILVS
jgi:uncharacterized RDD family membrane protein YckC